MKSTHHAILYRADPVCSVELPFENDNSETDNFFTEKFGIDDARELIRKANNRPAESSYQLLIVRTNFITLEAQNALLKVLEEPPISTNFVFVLPPDHIVLPTLVSRLCEYSFASEDKEEDGSEVFHDFIKKDHKGRILAIEHAIKNKDTEWQRSVKIGLIQYIKHNATELTSSLRELEFVSRLLLTRGASNKMLFEHAALLLPVR